MNILSKKNLDRGQEEAKEEGSVQSATPSLSKAGGGGGGLHGRHSEIINNFVACFSAKGISELINCTDGNIQMMLEGFPTLTVNEVVSLFRTRIVPSFPDVHSSIIPSTYHENGSTIIFESDLVGTFSGLPFSIGSLPPLHKTDKLVTVPAATVLIKLNKNSNKISTCMIAAPEDGLPGGPLGLYARAGGHLPSQISMLPSDVLGQQPDTSNVKSHDMPGIGNVPLQGSQVAHGQGMKHHGHHGERNNIAIVQEAYTLFKKGDFDECSKLFSDECVAQWGDQEALKMGIQSLPWCGVYTNPLQVKNCLQVMTSIMNIENMDNKKMLNVDGNMVLVLSEWTASKMNTDQRFQFTSIETLQLNHAGKICQFNSYADTKYLEQMLMSQNRSDSLINSKNAKNVQAVKAAYDLFAKGDIPTMLQQYVSPNVQWTWGGSPTALKAGFKPLPWSGLYQNVDQVGAAFGEYAKVFETLSFIPVSILPMNGNMVYAKVNLTMKNKHNGKQGEMLYFHVFEFDDNVKIIRWEDYCDTAYNQTFL